MLRNSGSISSTRSSSKALRLISCFGSTCENCARMIGACGLMLRMRPSSLLSAFSSSLTSAIFTRFASGVSATSTHCSSLAALVAELLPTRSHLFRMMRSANAICSMDSFSAPSGFSSSRCCSTCAASTTVMIPSRRYLAWMSSSAKKVCATGAGSAMPVVSISTASKSLTLSCMRLSASTRSPRTVQHMQPFITSITSSLMRVTSGPSTLLPAAAVEISFSSTPTSPNSFSMIAKRRPWSGERRMWFSKVVLPEPRKPVRMVTGTRASAMAEGKEGELAA
mmetsp:Transcript_68829/g.202036  ORF Transcript_68829/g.202036 Transcript_68829/m.202036 type:complete len:281 (-) Transcript_68829:1-843(-)